MSAGTDKGRDMLWQRFTVAIPYIWLLVFFLAPFAIILAGSARTVVISCAKFPNVRSGLCGFQLIWWNAKYSLYILRITNAYLNMRLFEEAGCFIYALAFKEDTSNRLKGFPSVALIDGVNVIDYGAVQIALQ